MSIYHFQDKIKPFLNIILFVEILLCIVGFLYIYTNKNTKSELKIVRTQNKENNQVIGSKNGKTYYFPWCASLSRIKIENRIFFDSVASAINNGYTKAKNCKGL